MIRTIAIVAALIVSIPAAAADAPKLSVEKIMQINFALAQLNCGQRTIKDGTKETQVCEPYKWSAGLTWQIATMQQKAQEVTTRYSAVRNKALAALPRKLDGTLTEEVAAQFAVQDRQSLDIEVDLDLPHFKKADLETMNLQPSIISALLPIID